MFMPKCNDVIDFAKQNPLIFQSFSIRSYFFCHLFIMLLACQMKQSFTHLLDHLAPQVLLFDDSFEHEVHFYFS